MSEHVDPVEVRHVAAAIRAAQRAAMPARMTLDEVLAVAIRASRAYAAKPHAIPTPVTLDVLAHPPAFQSIVWYIAADPGGRDAEPRAGRVRDVQPRADPHRVALVPLSGTQSRHAARWFEFSEVFLTYEHAQLALAQRAEDLRAGAAEMLLEYTNARDEHLAASVQQDPTSRAG